MPSSVKLLCHISLDIDEPIVTADKRLFSHISSSTHCLHHLLPPQCKVGTATSLRNRGHNFTLPAHRFQSLKKFFHQSFSVPVSLTPPSVHTTSTSYLFLQPSTTTCTIMVSTSQLVCCALCYILYVLLYM